MIDLSQLLFRTSFSRGRVIAGVLGAALLIALALVVLAGDGGPGDARDLVIGVGLELLLPILSLVFATAVLGDPAEDGTIGYVLTNPIARWRISVPAYLATTVVTVPLIAVPVTAALALNGVGVGSVLAYLVASAMGSLAYSAVFMALGLAVRRALLIGLLYVGIWEGFVSRVSTGLGRLSIGRYVTTVVTWLDDAQATDGPVSGPVAVAVLVGLVGAGIGLTTLLLRNHTVRT